MYKIIKLPLNLEIADLVPEKLMNGLATRFSDFKKEDLEDYFGWYLSIIPERILELEKYVVSTAGYEDWHADFTKESLTILNDWMKGKINKRSLTAKENQIYKSKLPNHIEIPKEDFTDETYSIIFDVSLYFSECIRKKDDNINWQINLVKDIFYGRPVLKGKGSVSLYAFQNVSVVARKVVNDRKPDLVELFDVWVKELK